VTNRTSVFPYEICRPAAAAAGLSYRRTALFAIGAARQGSGGWPNNKSSVGNHQG